MKINPDNPDDSDEKGDDVEVRIEFVDWRLRIRVGQNMDEPGRVAMKILRRFLLRAA